MTKQKSKPRRPRRDDRPLLSGATVLILSGFLIGQAYSRFFAGPLQDQVMCAGVAGLIAFIGLDHVEQRRRRRAEEEEQRLVETRLVKHVDRPADDEEDDLTDLRSLTQELRLASRR